MATTNIYFKALFKWPTSYANITSEGWLNIYALQDGSDSVSNAFAVAQNMTDSGQRSTLLSSIVSIINSRYSATITTQTESFATSGGFYQWTVNIEGTAEDPQENGTLGFVPSAFFTTSQSDLLFMVAWDAVDSGDITITECESCYELSKASCEDSYVLSLDLTPATDYVVAIYANNGNVYTQTCTANGSGELTIDATAPEFPDGFFIPESGGYVIKVFTDSDLTTVVHFIIGTNQYECIQLSFQYVTTTTSSIQAVFEYLIHDDDSDTDYFIIDDIGNNFIVG